MVPGTIIRFRIPIVDSWSTLLTETPRHLAASSRRMTRGMACGSSRWMSGRSATARIIFFCSGVMDISVSNIADSARLVVDSIKKILSGRIEYINCNIISEIQTSNIMCFVTADDRIMRGEMSPNRPTTAQPFQRRGDREIMSAFPALGQLLVQALKMAFFSTAQPPPNLCQKHVFSKKSKINMNQ